MTEFARCNEAPRGARDSSVTPGLSPRALHFAADLGSQGGSEENKVLGGGTFHFANAGFIFGTPNVFWVDSLGFGRNLPVGSTYLQQYITRNLGAL